jgi:hypothetical protein
MPAGRFVSSVAGGSWALALFNPKPASHHSVIPMILQRCRRAMPGIRHSHLKSNIFMIDLIFR